MFVVSARIPVKRTYPKVRDVPGVLYMNVAVLSERRYQPGAEIHIRAPNGNPLVAEVIESRMTTRTADMFQYTIA